jgi:hypothetical protein
LIHDLIKKAGQIFAEVCIGCFGRHRISIVQYSCTGGGFTSHCEFRFAV